MHRLLKPKNIHRLALALVLLAPLAYLFGSQFATLAGAHGEMMLADESTDVVTSRFLTIPKEDTQQNFSLPTTLGSSYAPFASENYYASYLYNVSAGTYVFHYPDDANFRFYVYTDGLLTSYQMLADFTTHEYTHSFSDNQSFAFVIYKMESPITVDINSYGYDLYLDAVNYRESLFGNMFGKSNFLTRWGENALSENPVGFAPFGSLFRFVDTNMLHLSNEQIGLMGYGYMYYAVHVLLFDVLVLALAFVATLPQRILNMVNDRGGID